MSTNWLSALLEPLQLELPSPPPDIPPPDKISPGILTIGLLNPLLPTVIQIVGPLQLQQLDSLSKKTRNEIFEHIYNTGTQLLIISDGNELKDINPVPVAHTPLSTESVLSGFTLELNRLNSAETYRHGVFMEVLGSGVLLTGSPNIGKSELSLELITRGHSLIADDVPCFSLIAGAIQGISSPMLKEFLEVRGLGVVNVRAMFGDNAVKHNKILDLIIHLRQFVHEQEIVVDRLFGAVHQQELLGKQVDTIEIPVAAGRNLAVLVETAVRNYNLKLKGYNSAKEFIKRQKSAMDTETE